MWIFRRPSHNTSHSLARDKVLCLIIKPVQGKERGEGREGVVRKRGVGKKERKMREKERERETVWKESGEEKSKNARQREGGK